jgi:hypothetical protein
MPLALLRYTVGLRLDPFGPGVFFFDPHAKRPFFKAKP